MRLRQYINEAKNIMYKSQVTPIISPIPEDFYRDIKKDCKEYLNLVNRYNAKFYRGMCDTHDFGRKSIRKDRLPHGMSKEKSENLNKFLISNGHADRSKSLLATSNKKYSMNFGRPFIIYPVGEFKYTWINKKDINIHEDWDDLEIFALNMVSLNKPFYDEEFLWWLERKFNVKNIEEKDRFEKKLGSIIKGMFTTNKGIEIAFKNAYEIWFECNNYYYEFSGHK